MGLVSNYRDYCTTIPDGPIRSREYNQLDIPRNWDRWDEQKIINLLNSSSAVDQNQAFPIDPRIRYEGVYWSSLASYRKDRPAFFFIFFWGGAPASSAGACHWDQITLSRSSSFECLLNYALQGMCLPGMKLTRIYLCHPQVYCDALAQKCPSVAIYGSLAPTRQP